MSPWQRQVGGHPRPIPTEHQEYAPQKGMFLVITASWRVVTRQPVWTTTGSDWLQDRLKFRKVGLGPVYIGFGPVFF